MNSITEPNSANSLQLRASGQARAAQRPSLAMRGRWLTERRCVLLLGSLLGLLALYPVLSGPIMVRTGVLDGLTSAVLIATVYATGRRRWHVAVALTLAAPVLLSRWLGIEEGASSAGVALSLFEIAFYLFTVVLLFSYVLNGRVVVGDRLAGALSVYLLVGIAFAEVYMLLEGVAPGSFTSNREALVWQDLIYFSFVTLTTLGYGDISPVTAQAEALVVMEAVVGVFYLAVLVAWLVSSLRAATESPVIDDKG